MLILSRNKGQSIFINGQEIKIHFLDVRGNQVRVGIEAPRDVKVDREEIYNLKTLHSPHKPNTIQFSKRAN